jgi:DNA end-binding protein Ku
MPARPFWSGYIQISLVSFGVKLFTATESKSEIRFHQLSRKTGERIRHQKVSGDADSEGAEKVEKDEIVKGYEYAKGQYVIIEPSEIENLRIPSRHTLEVSQFVDLDELDPGLFEKPYFVLPDNDQQLEAYSVVRKALQTTRKAAIGKIAFSGREHIVAISAPPESKDDAPESRGLMCYTLRYAEELRKPAEYFSEIKKVAIDDDQLSLAKELIKRKGAKFDLTKFTDQYEVALRELVDAKVKHAPIPYEEPARTSAKVVNLMDALRKSVGGSGAEETAATAKKKPPARATAAAAAESGKGISLVKPKSSRARKSA